MHCKGSHHYIASDRLCERPSDVAAEPQASQPQHGIVRRLHRVQQHMLLCTLIQLLCTESLTSPKHLLNHNLLLQSIKHMGYCMLLWKHRPVTVMLEKIAEQWHDTSKVRPLPPFQRWCSHPSGWKSDLPIRRQCLSAAILPRKTATVAV